MNIVGATGPSSPALKLFGRCAEGVGMDTPVGKASAGELLRCGVSQSGAVMALMDELELSSGDAQAAVEAAIDAGWRERSRTS